MAISKVNFTVTDGNLFSSIAGEDHVSALMFDVTNSPSGGAISADGEVNRIFSLKEAETLIADGGLSIDSNDSPIGVTSYENGVVHKHIADFFAINPNGELYVGLFDCSSSFDGISAIQRVAQGRVRQIGVYTDQELFIDGSTSYTLAGYLSELNTLATTDADDNNTPYSVIVSGNSATVASGTVDVEIGNIPTAIGSLEKVSISLGQANDSLTQSIQSDNNNATVGIIGTMIGCVSLASVEESIGWVSKFNVTATIPTIAMGFGGVIADINNNTPYESVAKGVRDNLDNFGYIFPVTYPDFAGTFLSSDQTLSSGDYRTIARNRTIDKSRRNVRIALLPTIQQPLLVNAETGGLGAGAIAQFKGLVDKQLSIMQSNGELSGKSVNIDPKQDVLANDGVKIKYRVIPYGVNKNIEVEIGLASQI